MQLLSGKSAYPRQRSMAVVNRGPQPMARGGFVPWYARMSKGQSFAPGGNYGYQTGGQMLLQQNHPGAGAATPQHKTVEPTPSNLGPPDPWDKWSSGQNPQNPPPKDPNNPPPEDPYFTWLKSDLNNQINVLQDNAQKQRRDILMGFGSRELASKYMKNDPLLATISDAPTSMSWLGQENYGYGLNQKNTNENLNASNLFYGGARNVALSQLAHKHLADVFNQTRSVQDLLNNIDTSTASSIADLKRQLMAAWIQQQGGGGGG